MNSSGHRGTNIDAGSPSGCYGKYLVRPVKTQKRDLYFVNLLYYDVPVGTDKAGALACVNQRAVGNVRRRETHHNHNAQVVESDL